MPDLSDDFKINVNKLNASEAVLTLLEITHPFITDPVRLVMDNCNVVSNGNTFIAMAFDIKRQDDIKDEVPKVEITLQNIGRSLVKWIDQSGGGRDAEVKAMLIRRSSPDLIEESINLSIERVFINSQFVRLSLTIQNNLIRKGTKWVFDKERAPGLF